MMVSVIMITYNHEKYIEEAINGILMQQCDFDIELIIADDCSPDNTEMVVNRIKETHPNGSWIKYTKHAKNKGMSLNFIWAAEQVKGKYTALCEGDDYWIDPFKIQKQVEFLEANIKCVYVFSGANTIRNESKGIYFSNDYFKTGIISKKVFLSNGGANFCTATVMFLTNILTPLPLFFKNSIVGDFPLALIAISKGDIGFLEDITSVYRQDSESSWISRLNYNRYLKNYYSGQDTLQQFDLHTNNKFRNITDGCRSTYKKNLIYYQIINKSVGKSFLVVVQNLSITNNFNYNKQILKTFLWKVFKKNKQ